MMPKTVRETLSSGAVIGVFFLSNLPAGLTVLWLVPGIVFLEAACWLFVALILAGLANKHHIFQGLAANLARNWIIVPFLIFSAISISWSIDWQISLARWLVLAATVVVAGYIGLRFNIERIINHLSILGVAILLLSAILVVFVPRIGVMNYYDIQGAWKGIYWHKNHMGIVAVFVCILFLISLARSLQARTRSVWLWGALYILSLGFVYQTDSVGSYLTLLVLHGLLAIALLYLRLRDHLRAYHYMIIGVVLLLGFLLLYGNLDRVFGAFNRNTSLTGRMPMWGHLFDIYIDKQPVLGYGFNAFWYDESHRVTMQHAAGYPDPIVISDNGFIDILLNTGYIGLALFLIFYLGMWGRSIQLALRAHNVVGLFPLILMSYTLLANLTWSLLFENESFMLLVLLTVMYSLSSRAANVPREVVAARASNEQQLTAGNVV